jgi:hypothetical protein
MLAGVADGFGLIMGVGLSLSNPNVLTDNNHQDPM